MEILFCASAALAFVTASFSWLSTRLQLEGFTVQGLRDRHVHLSNPRLRSARLSKLGLQSVSEQRETKVRTIARAHGAPVSVLNEILEFSDGDFQG